MCSSIRRALLTALLVCTASLPAKAEQSSQPQLREELLALPFELATLAYLVRPLGEVIFPLAVMKPGVLLKAMERVVFTFVESGYDGGLDVREHGIYGPFLSHVGTCDDPNFRDATLTIAPLDGWNRAEAHPGGGRFESLDHPTTISLGQFVAARKGASVKTVELPAGDD